MLLHNLCCLYKFWILFLSVGYFHVKMLMNVWWRMVGVQRCATTQREVSSAAAFYQAMRSQRTVSTVLVCKPAELSENGCVSNYPVNFSLLAKIYFCQFCGPLY